MEIVPARGRRRRDGRSAASASAFPWERAAATPYRPVEEDVSYGADDSHDPDGGDEGQYGSPGAYGRVPQDDDAYDEYEDAGSDPGDDTSGGGYRYEPKHYAFDGGDADADADPTDDAGWGHAGWDDAGWGDAGRDSDSAADDSGWPRESDGDDAGWDDAGSYDEDSHDEDSHDTVALGDLGHEGLDGQDGNDQDGNDQDGNDQDDAGAGAAPRRRTRRDGRQTSRRRPSAGRNLPAAIAVGVGLGGLVAASLFIRKEAFVAVVAVAVGLAVWELAQAFTARRIAVPLVPVLVGSLGMVVSGFASGEEAMLVAFALTSLAVLLWRVIDGLDGAVRDVAAGIFTAAYVPFLAGFAMLMLAADDGPARIVVFVLVTVASDVGGYAVGVVAGRHPMAPSVSPKKSWEGLGGSVAFCLVAGMVSVPVLLGGAWWAGALLGLATVVTATVGDLSESLLKRDLGIKDMGSLLPGHGGMMDRLDSLLPTAPAAYLLLAVLVPVAS